MLRICFKAFCYLQREEENANIKFNCVQTPKATPPTTSTPPVHVIAQLVTISYQRATSEGTTTIKPHKARPHACKYVHIIIWTYIYIFFLFQCLLLLPVVLNLRKMAQRNKLKCSNSLKLCVFPFETHFVYPCRVSSF